MHVGASVLVRVCERAHVGACLHVGVNKHAFWCMFLR